MSSKKKVQSNGRFRPKYRIKKGDTVLVVAGEDKGMEGRVLKVYLDTGRAIVEGVNVIKRHTKPNTQYPNGGIIEKEAAIHISNIKLVDPRTGEATRVGRKVEGDKIVRYAKKSGEVLS